MLTSVKFPAIANEDAFALAQIINALEEFTFIAGNFTEISTSGALTSDLSVLDSSYWNTTDNKPSWKQAADKVYTVVALA